MKLPPFAYARPASLAEAVALLAAHDGEAKPLAGGQSLVPMLAFRVAAPSLIIDLASSKSCAGSGYPTTASRSAPWCAGATFSTMKDYARRTRSW
jgi:CO/xanthine dehydrogenase FAD-binding subunit